MVLFLIGAAILKEAFDLKVKFFDIFSGEL